MRREGAQSRTPMEPREADDNLKSLAKVVRILDCFSTTNRTLSLSEICETTGYPRSTTHRLIASMRDVGLLDQDRQRDRYRLGIRLFELGNIVLSNMDLHREARPHADMLSRITDMLVHLAVFDGRQAVVIHRSDPNPEHGTSLVLIESAPLHCTSVGKAILAYQPPEKIDSIIASGLRKYTDATITDPEELRAELEEIRQRRYAVDNGEHQPGLRCIGAPIRDATGRCVGGMSVSGSAWRIPMAEVEPLSKVVIHHADAVSSVL